MAQVNYGNITRTFGAKSSTISAKWKSVKLFTVLCWLSVLLLVQIYVAFFLLDIERCKKQQDARLINNPSNAAVAVTNASSLPSPSTMSTTTSSKVHAIPITTATSTTMAEESEIIMSVHNLLCSNNNSKVKVKSKDWKHLCSGGFVKDAARLLYSGVDVDVVQIGAHVGFEVGDPIASGILGLLDKVVAAAALSFMQEEVVQRDHFHWTFVEPSPANFKRLSENLSKNSHICDMRGINAAVVSDFTNKEDDPNNNNNNNSNQMIFYSMRDTIDPETGYDSISGKKLPFWITQVSSFSKLPILYNEKIFTERGLDVNDYIVETKIKSMRYSDLMREAMGVEQYSSSGQQGRRPLLVLIDTELFDCEIINGIDPSSPFLPKYLLFEHKCDHRETYRHLEAMGYSLYRSVDNTVAVLNHENIR
mmetsp:Transcript_11576/g.21648  ORF Transcript_11576/g.21648 Transcript_11576/m.21648 type:complete len:421 (-) Transcript_11576:248-1510(-)